MCVDPVHTFLPPADSSGARVGMLCRSREAVVHGLPELLLLLVLPGSRQEWELQQGGVFVLPYAPCNQRHRQEPQAAASFGSTGRLPHEFWR